MLVAPAGRGRLGSTPGQRIQLIYPVHVHADGRGLINRLTNSDGRMCEVTTPSMGPVLAARVLAEQLMLLRKAAGLRTMQVAKARNCTASHISQLEHARNPPSADDLDFLLELYGAGDRFDQLDMFRVAATESSWVSSYDISPSIKAYLGLESDAVSLERFALEVVPGILQTEGYAREVLRTYLTPPDDVEQNVAIRKRRWQRVQSGQMATNVILSEAALARTSFMRQVGLAQLDRLLEIVQTPGAKLRVLPFSSGMHQSMTAGFTLLRFPAGSLAPVALHEHAWGSGINNDQATVRKIEERYRELELASLDREGTLEMIQDAIDGAKEIIHNVCA